MFERLTESNSRDPYKDPPLTREDFERAEAVIRKFARHFAGTEHGRAFAACVRLLSKLDTDPGSDVARQRGYLLRHLRANEPRYALHAGLKVFALAFVDDAKQFVKHRSQLGEKTTGHPLRDPWLSISYILNLYGGKEPDLDLVLSDLSK